MNKFSQILITLLLAICLWPVYANNIFNKHISGPNDLSSLTAFLPKTHHKLVIIAHRGSHLKFPENTLAAYAEAIKEGADYVEIDLRTTKDGHLVIMHDESTTRLTGKKGLIKDLNYSEIRDLKIKSTNKEDTTTYRIPDFKSVLNLCKGKINIYLDFKEADVEKTYQLIKEAGMQNNLVVYLNKEEQYGQWKKISPGIPLMASLPENMNISQLNTLLDKRPVDIVDNAYNNETVNLMHKRKIAVWVDVQGNDENPEKWEQALKLGPGGLQTDHPEKLIKYLESEGKR